MPWLVDNKTGNACCRGLHAAAQVDEVKNIMVDNIEKVLERGEKIELLVDKTDNLRFQVACRGSPSAQLPGPTAACMQAWLPVPDRGPRLMHPARWTCMTRATHDGLGIARVVSSC